MLVIVRVIYLLCNFYVVIECLNFIDKNQQDKSLQIVTKNGIVQGREKFTVKRNKYMSYEGIPYAEPPLGELRFRDPVPVKSWKSVLDATGLGQSCGELLLRIWGVSVRGYEDCLYLNVYVPKKAQTEPLPVIFWIYGGAFIEGNANAYNPTNLIDQDLIVVTFNYRIGALGFLSTEDYASSGNYGLKDQNVALKWIRDNIRSFGGDPNRVTISGQSAGACSVMHQILSKQSRGLFSRAIAMSGETTTIWCKQKEPKNIALSLSLSLGIDTDNTTEMVRLLRQKSFNNIMNAQMMTAIAMAPTILDSGGFFSPTVEPDYPGAFMTEPSDKLLKSGSFTRVPLMIGMGTHEAGFFAKLIDLIKPFLSIFDLSPSTVPSGINNRSFKVKRLIGRKILEKYAATGSAATVTTEELMNLVTDLLYTVPITRTIRSMFHKMPVYYYVHTEANVVTKKVMQSIGAPVDANINGTVHGEDIPLIWNFYDFLISPRGLELRKKFTKIWRNFAYTGNPTPGYDPELGVIWKPVQNGKNMTYLNLNKKLKIDYNYKSDVMNFWDDLYNKYDE